MSLILRNPHSVLAVLSTRPKDVTELRLPAGSDKSPPSEAWGRVLQLARKHSIRVTSAARGSDDASQRGGHRGRPQDAKSSSKSMEGGRAGGAEAVVNERSPISTEELFEGARERSEGKGLWLALDCLTDPHNVGAIFRSAAFFGVEGILLTQERSAPLTATVYDVASGGLEYVPVAIQVNLQRAFETAKEAGLWILGTSEHAPENVQKIERDRPWLLVLGNEEKGMRRLTEESCDLLCKIPPVGEVTSLNASVAAAIFISKLTGAF